MVQLSWLKKGYQRRVDNFVDFVTYFVLFCLLLCDMERRLVYFLLRWTQIDGRRFLCWGKGSWMSCHEKITLREKKAIN